MQDYTRGTNESSRNDAARLNHQCRCITLSREALIERFREQLPNTGGESSIIPDIDDFFSNTAVFVPDADLSAMRRIVQTIESVSQLPSYRDQVLSWAPVIAHFDPGPEGAFMGYDFHLGADGPQLIEINTNAGGAFLNAELARAQQQCCTLAQQRVLTNQALDEFEHSVLTMFKREWQAQRNDSTLGTVAIVDDDPWNQFLAPEFQLAQQLLRNQGLNALIVAPSELTYDNGNLGARGHTIDLVYNRLVDFALDDPAHAILRRAYIEGAVVVTPNPRVHALFADKRNLTLLSSPHLLNDPALTEVDAELLKRAVPETRLVCAEDTAALWRDRRNLFFKPVAGHGSKGVYRGSKITRRVFDRIMRDDYVAQRFVTPGQRSIQVDGTTTTTKVDVRLYTYAGTPLLAAARLYQGQTTNFRTPGIGFAPVFQV